MGILEDIKRMQQEGKSDQDMIILLQQYGYGIKEISDSLAQAKIKQAVSENGQDSMTAPMTGQEQGMMQSMLNQSQVPKEDQEQPQQEESPQQLPRIPSPEEVYAQAHAPPPPYIPQTNQAIPQPEYAEQGEYQQQQYAPYDSSYQSYGTGNQDAMSEIAEQVMSEKLSSLRKQLESIWDMKNSFEAKMSSMDDRLKRMEKVIDRIQLSILQKVGEYVTNVEDIKKEMIETQKSF